MPNRSDQAVIVAFLQNMWVHARSVPRVSRWHPTSEQRERMIHYALFAGCVTGKRLKATLGEDLCARIVWQEANPTIADNPQDYYPPDLVHVRAVLNKHRPELVLCFTKAGESLIRSMLDEGMSFISCPHPACRRVDETMSALRSVRTAVEELGAVAKMESYEIHEKGRA